MDITIETIFGWGSDLIETSKDIVAWFSSGINIAGFEFSMASLIFSAGILSFSTFIVVKFILDIIT